jgi:hypothetical protein
MLATAGKMRVSCTLEKQHHALNIVTRYKYTTKYYNGFTKYLEENVRNYTLRRLENRLAFNRITIHCNKNQSFTEISSAVTTIFVL